MIHTSFPGVNRGPLGRALELVLNSRLMKETYHDATGPFAFLCGELTSGL